MNTVIWPAWFRLAIVAAPIGWLALFFLAPLAIAVAISLASPVDAAPPFVFDGRFSAWSIIGGDAIYADALVNSLRIAATATLLTALIGFPMAYAIARAAPKRRALLLVLLMVPFWTALLIRVYAWTTLLRPTGVVNAAITGLFGADAALDLMGGAFAVHLGMVHVYLPFMVLPLYARIRAIDPELEDAAADLGATPLARFATVVLPLAMPGLIAGSLLVFIPASAEFVIPELLGSSDTPMLGRTIWNEFFANRDWPAAAALALALFALLALPIVALQRYGSAR